MHSPEHQQLALQAAREGIVLLKNQNNLLPLKKDLKSIAVIGPNADDRWNQLGDYSPSEVPQKVITVLDGIKQAVSPATQVMYVKGCEVIGGKEDFAKAVEAARQRERGCCRCRRASRQWRQRQCSADRWRGLRCCQSRPDRRPGRSGQGHPGNRHASRSRSHERRPLSIPWAANMSPPSSKHGSRANAAVKRWRMYCSATSTPAGVSQLQFLEALASFPTTTTTSPRKNIGSSRPGVMIGGYADMPGTPLYPFGYGLSYTNFVVQQSAYFPCRKFLPRELRKLMST